MSTATDIYKEQGNPSSLRENTATNVFGHTGPANYYNLFNMFKVGLVVVWRRGALVIYTLNKHTYI